MLGTTSTRCPPSLCSVKLVILGSTVNVGDERVHYAARLPVRAEEPSIRGRIFNGPVPLPAEVVTVTIPLMAASATDVRRNASRRRSP